MTMLKLRCVLVYVNSPMMSGGFNTVPLGSVRETSWYVPSRLGVCAAAVLTHRNAMTTTTPDRGQKCRGKANGFIGTSLQDGDEVAGCVPCAPVPATPSWHRALLPWCTAPAAGARHERTLSPVACTGVRCSG